MVLSSKQSSSAVLDKYERLPAWDCKYQAVVFIPSVEGHAVTKTASNSWVGIQPFNAKECRVNRGTNELDQCSPGTCQSIWAKCSVLLGGLLYSVQVKAALLTQQTSLELRSEVLQDFLNI